MTTHDLHAIYTVLMFITFVGIWAWAWSKRRRRAFSEAAMLPFADEAIAQRSGEPVAEQKGDAS